MSAKIDPVEVARMVMDIISPDETSISAQHALALANVVIAASEFIAAERNVRDAEFETPLAYTDAVLEMNEAHAAMCAALKGE